MARTIIDVPDEQLAEMDALVKLLGISRAEGVRRALKEFIRSNHKVNPDGFGLWCKPDAADHTSLVRKHGAH